MERFAGEVNAASPIPENFKRVYVALYPQHLHATMTDKLIFNYAYRYFFQVRDVDARPYCHCEDVYYTQIRYNEELKNIEWVTRMRRLEYGFALENYTTPEKCFDYVMKERIRELKSTLKEQCNIIEKPLDRMTDDDLIELILLLKSRKKYDRYQNPQAFDGAFQKCKKELADYRQARSHDTL